MTSSGAGTSLTEADFSPKVERGIRPKSPCHLILAGTRAARAFPIPVLATWRPYAPSFSTSSAANLPGAAMIPPPGWVAEPHM